MKVEISIPMSVFSVNKYRCGYSPRKTTLAREFEEDFNKYLENFRESLSSFAENWKKIRGSIKATYTAYYPESLYFNAKGEVSATGTHDLTNWEKPVQDLVFKFMGLNDCFVRPLTSDKLPANDYEIRVTLELVPSPGRRYTVNP